jgi:hypothetical protein
MNQKKKKKKNDDDDDDDDCGPFLSKRERELDNRKT